MPTGTKPQGIISNIGRLLDAAGQEQLSHGNHHGRDRNKRGHGRREQKSAALRTAEIEVEGEQATPKQKDERHLPKNRSVDTQTAAHTTGHSGTGWPCGFAGEETAREADHGALTAQKAGLETPAFL